VSLVRILIWSLADSKTSIEEVREHLPQAPDGTVWFANQPADRFGLVAHGEELPPLEALRTLIGKDPDVAEEFDAL
jgi:hypothetical protein